MQPENLLHPLKFDVVDFKEEEHDYHFRVELPEPTCCQACGALESRIVKFGKDDQAYRDVPVHGKPGEQDWVRQAKAELAASRRK